MYMCIILLHFISYYVRICLYYDIHESFSMSHFIYYNNRFIHESFSLSHLIIDLFMNHSLRHANHFSGHTQLIAAHGKPIDIETAQVIIINSNITKLTKLNCHEYCYTSYIIISQLVLHLCSVILNMFVLFIIDIA